MSDVNWGNLGVVTTEETTILFSEDQQSFDIWTVASNEAGGIMPKLLGNHLGLTFIEAVRGWAAFNDMEDYLDPLGLTYDGLPLVESRSEAMSLAGQYRRV